MLIDYEADLLFMLTCEIGISASDSGRILSDFSCASIFDYGLQFSIILVKLRIFLIGDSNTKLIIKAPKKLLNIENIS